MENIDIVVKKFEEEIGYAFKRKDLLRNALTHPSFNPSSFEILEFIGDRVINLIIAKIIFQSNPPANEKEYAQKFVGLTNKDALYQAGIRMKLNEYVLWTGSPAHHKTIIQDATEAIIGAIYLDAGMDFAFKFTQQIWENVENKAFDEIDPKSSLQVWASRRKIELKYDLMKTSGPPHDRRYVVKLSVNDYNDFFGFGPSIRSAEKDAAEKFLRRYKDE